MSIQEPSEESTTKPFICDCEGWMRTACKGEEFYKEYEGKRFCVLHYPGNKKAEDFNVALMRKLESKDFDFCGIWFPYRANFSKVSFSADADFSKATFSMGAIFRNAEFRKANFSNANFSASTDFALAKFSEDANFSNANFSADAQFKDTDFKEAADYREVTFSGNVSFIAASFRAAADFSKASLGGKANFSEVSFRAAADFSEVSFSAAADFSKANFSAVADFSKANFSAAADFSDASFSAVANFSDASFSKDTKFFSATFGADANFFMATFSANSYFGSAIFSADATFIKANFSAAASFNDASFSADATFFMANFSAFADFSKANFSATAGFFAANFRTHANFSKANFSADAYFGSAAFGADVDLRNAVFDAAANFYSVTFKDHVYFAGSSEMRTLGDHPQLNLQFAHFEKPDRVSFHTLNLQPHWFVNVDSRKFEFTDVEFNYELKDELERLNKIKVGAPHRLLAIACRQLAVNAEENHRYRQAADFRYASMDARRLEWLQDRKLKKFQFLHWLYWIASGYGESVRRAFWALVILWLLFAFSYTKVGFEHKTDKPGNDQQSITAQENVAGKPLPFTKIFTYSLGVMSLQKPDPKPVTTAAQTIVIVETILCPIQAALLALAIRRRFMR